MVEIRIDTRNDSKEDIRKAIEFLQKFADSGSSSSSEGMKNIFNNDMPMVSPDMGMGSSSSGSSEEKDIFGNPLSDKKGKKYSDDEVRIIPY